MISMTYRNGRNGIIPIDNRIYYYEVNSYSGQYSGGEKNKLCFSIDLGIHSDMCKHIMVDRTMRLSSDRTERRYDIGIVNKNKEIDIKTIIISTSGKETTVVRKQNNDLDVELKHAKREINDLYGGKIEYFVMVSDPKKEVYRSFLVFLDDGTLRAYKTYIGDTYMEGDFDYIAYKNYVMLNNGNVWILKQDKKNLFCVEYLFSARGAIYATGRVSPQERYEGVNKRRRQLPSGIGRVLSGKRTQFWNYIESVNCIVTNKGYFSLENLSDSVRWRSIDKVLQDEGVDSVVDNHRAISIPAFYILTKKGNVYEVEPDFDNKRLEISVQVASDIKKLYDGYFCLTKNNELFDLVNGEIIEGDIMDYIGQITWDDSSKNDVIDAIEEHGRFKIEKDVRRLAISLGNDKYYHIYGQKQTSLLWRKQGIILPPKPFSGDDYTSFQALSNPYLFADYICSRGESKNKLSHSVRAE